MARRTIKEFYSPGGRFTIEEAREAARLAQEAAATKNASKGPAAKKPVAKKTAAKKSR